MLYSLLPFWDTQGEDIYDEKIYIQSEEDVFKVLDMPYREPHERNMRGVIKKKYLIHEE